jgi:hypothetical protein
LDAHQPVRLTAGQVQPIGELSLFNTGTHWQRECAGTTSALRRWLPPLSGKIDGTGKENEKALKSYTDQVCLDVVVPLPLMR